MKKNIYLSATIISLFLFHYQILAQETDKTVIVSEKSRSHIDIPPFIVEYETIPKDSNTYITAEYNIGIMQDSIEFNLADTMKKYAEIATSDILRIYDADALIGLRTDTSTNEIGEMLVILSGFPVRWGNIKTLAEYYAEKRRAKPKKTYKKGSLGFDLAAGAIIKKEVNISSQDSVTLNKYPTFALGIRYIYYKKTYFDADIKINFNAPFRMAQDDKLMNLQLMAGVKGYTPNFYKSISGYAAARLGYGVFFLDNFKSGFAVEMEAGFKIIPALFVAFAYNLNCVFVYKESNLDPWGFNKYQYPNVDTYNTLALRIGFVF